jgi:type II secretory pathway component GspD/PulD (secretin)
VLASNRSYAAPEIYDGPRETREYDVAKVIDRISKDSGSKDKARQMLGATLKQIYYRSQPSDDASVSGNKAYNDPTDAKEAVNATVDRSPVTCTINGTTLSATAPAVLHDSLRHMLDAWGESGLAQIAVETRFLSSNRDLVSDLGVPWQFLEAFSSERDNAFPSARHDGGPVVHAAATVDEYLPLVVSTLNEVQTAKLLDIAQADSRANVLNAPKITMFNGTEATISDCAQRPFVVGVFQQTAGAIEPKVVVLEEGTKIKIRAALGEKNVRLQASLEMKALGDVTTASTKFRGSPVSIQVPSVNRRCIDVGAKDGETLLVGSIPTGKQQQYLYYLLSARRIEDVAPDNK